MSGVADRLRGALFYATFYGSMVVVGALFWLPAARSEASAKRVAKAFFRTMVWLMRVICGVRTEIRGAPPTGRALIAAKHQSMLDVFILYAILPEARFVMKKELASAPIFGWYARRVGCVPVDRGGGKAARESMIAAMLRGSQGETQMVIYPQGTRVPPGRRKEYRSGVHGLYAATGLPCAPVATNAGARLPRGLAARPGPAVVEFLRPIPPGMAPGPFMAILEREMESASDALLAEAP